MSLQEDIFNEFIKKLETAEMPTKIIAELRKLWTNNKLDSKEEIISVLKERTENATN